jgi:hypothetical protein
MSKGPTNHSNDAHHRMRNSLLTHGPGQPRAKSRTSRIPRSKAAYTTFNICGVFCLTCTEFLNLWCASPTSSRLIYEE